MNDFTYGLGQNLQHALDLQRQAYLAHPVPTLQERKADLRTLLVTAATVPGPRIGFNPALFNAGATITLLLGTIFLLAFILSPRYGLFRVNPASK